MSAVPTKDMVVNPFRGETLAGTSTGSALARTDQIRAVAEVQAALAVARANPRDAVAAVDRLLNACTRPALAESAVYQYARGGSDITGPSIRLAEAAAQCWGNMAFGIRELEQRPGESVVQAYAWDVEANTRREVTFSVPHKRHTKGGDYVLTDPRDIYETVANQGSRRLRACILAVIPGDVIEAAVSQCELTMKTKADTSPEAMAKMVKAFGEYGVTKAQIEQRIQRRLDAVTSAQVVALKKIYLSLRDGMSRPEDWFSAGASPDGESSVADLNARLRPPAAPGPLWPRKEGEDWVDVDGAVFDPMSHAWSNEGQCPSVTGEGRFRARRGTRQARTTDQVETPVGEALDGSTDAEG